MTRRPWLGDDDVRTTPFFDPFWVPLYPNQTMFHGMVKPVTSSANGDETLQMVDLHPSNLIANFVPPCLKTNMASVNSPCRTPKKKDTLVLEILEWKVQYGLVRNGAIWKLYGTTYESVRNTAADGMKLEY